MIERQQIPLGEPVASAVISTEPQMSCWTVPNVLAGAPGFLQVGRQRRDVEGLLVLRVLNHVAQPPTAGHASRTTEVAGVHLRVPRHHHVALARPLEARCSLAHTAPHHRLTSNNGGARGRRLSISGRRDCPAAVQHLGTGRRVAHAWFAEGSIAGIA